MPAPKFTGLQALSDREYRRLASGRPDPLPADRAFKAKKLSLDHYDSRWDRKRGTAMRLTGVLLRESDQAMQDRVCADREATKTYRNAAGWLEHEAELLRKSAKLHDLAVARLTAVLARCNGEASAS